MDVEKKKNDGGRAEHRREEWERDGPECEKEGIMMREGAEYEKEEQNEGRELECEKG